MNGHVSLYLGIKSCCLFPFLGLEGPGSDSAARFNAILQPGRNRLRLSACVVQEFVEAKMLSATVMSVRLSCFTRCIVGYKVCFREMDGKIVVLVFTAKMLWMFSAQKGMIDAKIWFPGTHYQKQYSRDRCRLFTKTRTKYGYSGTVGSYVAPIPGHRPGSKRFAGFCLFVCLFFSYTTGRLLG